MCVILVVGCRLSRLRSGAEVVQIGSVKPFVLLILFVQKPYAVVLFCTSQLLCFVAVSFDLGKNKASWDLDSSQLAHGVV